MRGCCCLVLLALSIQLQAVHRPHRHYHRRPRSPALRQQVSRIPWQHITAGGAAAGTVIAAYKISDGVEEGLKTVAQKEPAAFTDFLSTLTRPLRWALFAALGCAGFFLWRKIKKQKSPKKDSVKSSMKK